jgi:hypothetical protein
MGKIHNRFVILLEVNQVLALDELADIAEQAAAATSPVPAA